MISQVCPYLVNGMSLASSCSESAVHGSSLNNHDRWLETVCVECPTHAWLGTDGHQAKVAAEMPMVVTTMMLREAFISFGFAGNPPRYELHRPCNDSL